MADNPAPHTSPFERFQEAAKAIFSVPKREVEKAELRKRKEKEARDTERRGSS